MMMIKSIKNSIWNCIKDKEVALFMIFSDEGEILWHQGREVKGRHINDGKGFCRSYCLEALKKQREIAKEDCLINLNGHCFSESALILNIKQLIICVLREALFQKTDIIALLKLSPNRFKLLHEPNGQRFLFEI
jgi:hypothetical protein